MAEKSQLKRENRVGQETEYVTAGPSVMYLTAQGNKPSCTFETTQG